MRTCTDQLREANIPINENLLDLKMRQHAC